MSHKNSEPPRRSGRGPKQRSLHSVLRGARHWFVVRFLQKHSCFIDISDLGIRLEVPADTIFSWNLAKYLSYEPDLTQWVTERMRGRQVTFVDVGASFGWFTCVVARHALSGSRVVSFEPDETARTFLRQNVSNNDPQGVVSLISKGVGSKSGIADFYRAPSSNPGMHSLVPMAHLAGAEPAYRVAVTTLDEELAEVPGTIDLIKLDIEGFEMDALLGARETLKRTHALAIEYSPDFLRHAGHDPEDMLRLLADEGFTFFEMNGSLPEIRSIDEIQAATREADWSFFQMNLVCVRG